MLQVEPGTPICRSAAREAYESGCGSQVRPVGEKPAPGASPIHGIGMRQPSRPTWSRSERNQIGSWRRSSGTVVCSGSPSSSPWYRYADPGSASIISVAARARLMPSAASGCGSVAAMPSVSEVSSRARRVACLTTSWLLSTHVVGAPTAAFAAIVFVITRR